MTIMEPISRIEEVDSYAHELRRSRMRRLFVLIGILAVIAAAYLVGPFSPIPNAWYAAPVLIFGFPVGFVVLESYRPRHG